MAARKTRPPKHKTRPLAQLRKEWKESTIRTSVVAVDIIDSLLEYARPAAAVIRARVATVVDIALAAVDVTATVFVMNDGGRFYRRHLLAEAAAASPSSCAAGAATPAWTTTLWPPLSPPTTWTSASRRPYAGLEAGYRLYTARWSLSDLPARRRPLTPAPDPDRQAPADPGELAEPRPPGQDAGEWEIPRIPLQYERAVLAGAVVWERLRTTPTTATAVRPQHSEAHLNWALITMMTRRLTRKSPRTSQWTKKPPAVRA
ncbi:hypothetical protein ABT090_33515 [Streptomyces asoensis]|uniref:hypothetical protein n=1 Tax=Streptomyces asoensis TaxID=249586 RepID=UPI0033320BB8